MSKLIILALIAAFLLAGCVGQTGTTAATGAAIESTVDDIAGDISGLTTDSSDLAVPATDFTVP